MDLLRKKEIKDNEYSTHSTLRRCLKCTDLVALGIGVLIGAGVFVLTGVVSATLSGPGIIISFLIAAIACTFSAFAYAELAASIGGCGSAYSYAYRGFGELIAWIVGWDLLLEYSIAISTVSVGWSGYFSDLLKALHLSLPETLTHGPLEGGIVNILSILILFVISCLLMIGIKTSARFNNIMVLIKLTILFLFLSCAITHVNVENFKPFAPFGMQGIIQGAAIIFFAFVGFDAITTAAEETLNPQKDIPRGILIALFICTLLFMAIGGLLTGIVKYSSLNVPSPLTHALLSVGEPLIAGLIGVGAIAGLTTVMLVLFYGLSRVFLAMARDGLLPKYFSKINPKTQTPIRIIVPCGVMMGLASGFIPIKDLAELVNIGTLFAFIIVCIGVIVLRYQHPNLNRPFKTPLMPLIPIFGALTSAYLIAHLPGLTLIRFIAWLAIGLLIFFRFSRHHSELIQERRS